LHSASFSILIPPLLPLGAPFLGVANLCAPRVKAWTQREEREDKGDRGVGTQEERERKRSVETTWTAVSPRRSPRGKREYTGE
jgi:hypothetical protein